MDAEKFVLIEVAKEHGRKDGIRWGVVMTIALFSFATAFQVFINNIDSLIKGYVCK